MSSATDISKNVPPGPAEETASDLVDRLEDLIAEWEGALNDDAVAETKVLLPGGQEIDVTQLGFEDPHLVIVEGRDAKGHEVLVAVPQSQLVVVVTARSVDEVAKAKKPDHADHVRGFHLPHVRAGKTE